MIYHLILQFIFHPAQSNENRKSDLIPSHCTNLPDGDTAGPTAHRPFEIFTCVSVPHLSSSEQPESTGMTPLLHWWQYKRHHLLSAKPSISCHGSRWEFRLSCTTLRSSNAPQKKGRGIKTLRSVPPRCRHTCLSEKQTKKNHRQQGFLAPKPENEIWRIEMQKRFYCNSRKTETSFRPGSTARIQF